MTRARRVERIADIRHLVGSWKVSGPVGLVPTMGALHAGHERLIQRARDECARVVVSIFVNPLQFDRKDDLDRYPRTLESDIETCERLGVDALFRPSVEEMYPSAPACTVMCQSRCPRNRSAPRSRACSTAGFMCRRK